MASTLATLIASIKEVFTALISMAVEVGTVVVTNPILLIGLLVSVAGAGVGIFKRLIRM